MQRHAEEEEDAGEVAAATTDGDGATPRRRRLSLREAAAYSALALCAIAATLLSGDRDRYPFGGAWDGPCRPCECDGNGTLVSCDLPAELKILFIFLDDRGIADIKPGAFKGLDYLLAFSLSSNRIATLRVGAFGGLPHLVGLDLSYNRIATIEPGAFRGLRSLSILGLRDNSLVSLTAGALDIGGYDDGLRNLFLDDCDRLREVEVGALPGALQHVWLPGAALNCSQIAPRLPGGATYLDGAYCDVEELMRIGTGDCDDSKGDYDTAECAWDGGDC